MGEKWYVMRRLIYVPIIHTAADLGSLAEEIEERTKAVFGDADWQKHKEAVNLYWQEIYDYWEQQNIPGLKIFQDGMPVDGLAGENIVKSMAHNGSINYKIVEQLIDKGAKLVQTEDAELLKEEYFLTRDLTKSDPTSISPQALSQYKSRKDWLLKARDTYIARRIDENLEDGETGVCFLGAGHQILSRLPKTIEVITLKDPEKVIGKLLNPSVGL
jgi:hypothetical protein